MTTQPAPARQYTATKAHGGGVGAGAGAIIATAIVTQWPDLGPWADVITMIGVPIVMGWFGAYFAPANRLK